MAEDGQLARIAGRAASVEEPTIAELLDPIALEERLREARARRAETLARRSDPAVPQPGIAPPFRTAAHEPPAFLDRPPAEPPTRNRPFATVPLVVFFAGLGLGGAVVAVLALLALPARVSHPPAARFTPAAAVAPAAAPAVAPVVAATPPAAAPTPTPDRAPPEAPLPAAAPAQHDPSGLAAPAAETPPPPDAAPPPVLEAAAPQPPAEAPLPSRVYIHFPASAAEAATAARDALSSAGVSDVEIVPVRYAIGRSNIRYYHAGDREPALALAPLLTPALGGAAPEARDFTDYATPAAPGNVELWLAGTPAGSTARAATPRRTAPATPRTAPDTPFLMPGVIAPPPTQAEQVERILIERLRQGR